MRDIKFRGKRVIGCDHVWVYGDLVQQNGGKRTFIEDDGEDYSVMPETVGMWTGFDSPLTHHGQGYGVEIYKDDIVTWERHTSSNSVTIETGWVDWSQHRGAWVMRWKESGRELCINLADILMCNKVIVIGNLYQNPELLK